jgi:hypothetical protein
VHEGVKFYSFQKSIGKVSIFLLKGDIECCVRVDVLQDGNCVRFIFREGLAVHFIENTFYNVNMNSIFHEIMQSCSNSRENVETQLQKAIFVDHCHIKFGLFLNNSFNDLPI